MDCLTEISLQFENIQIALVLQRKLKPAPDELRILNRLIDNYVQNNNIKLIDQNKRYFMSMNFEFFSFEF